MFQRLKTSSTTFARRKKEKEGTSFGFFLVAIWKEMHLILLEIIQLPPEQTH